MSESSFVEYAIRYKKKNHLEKVEKREHQIYSYCSTANGRSTVIIDCPFCGGKTVAYVWSLAGHGKRCELCDVIHTYYGFSLDDLNKHSNRGELVPAGETNG